MFICSILWSLCTCLLENNLIECAGEDNKGDKANLTAPWNGGSPNPLPANQQQSVPNTHSVPPAFAGPALHKPAGAPPRGMTASHFLSCVTSMFPVVLGIPLSLLYPPAKLCCLGSAFSRMWCCIYWGTLMRNILCSLPVPGLCKIFRFNIFSIGASFLHWGPEADSLSIVFLLIS